MSLLIHLSEEKVPVVWEAFPWERSWAVLVCALRWLSLAGAGGGSLVVQSHHRVSRRSSVSRSRCPCGGVKLWHVLLQRVKF